MSATEAKIQLPIMYNDMECHGNCPGLSVFDVNPQQDDGYCLYFALRTGPWPGRRLTECVDAEAK